MTCVIENLQRRLKGVGRGCREPDVLKNIYNSLLPIPTANLQTECLLPLRHSLPTDGNILPQLSAELKVHGSSSRRNIFYKKYSNFTVSVYYRHSKMYYIAITSDV